MTEQIGAGTIEIGFEIGSDLLNSLNRKNISLDSQHILALILRFQDRKRSTKQPRSGFSMPHVNLHSFSGEVLHIIHRCQNRQ